MRTTSASFSCVASTSMSPTRIFNLRPLRLSIHPLKTKPIAAPRSGATGSRPARTASGAAPRNLSPRSFTSSPDARSFSRNARTASLKLWRVSTVSLRDSADLFEEGIREFVGLGTISRPASEDVDSISGFAYANVTRTRARQPPGLLHRWRDGGDGSRGTQFSEDGWGRGPGARAESSCYPISSCSLRPMASGSSGRRQAG